MPTKEELLQKAEKLNEEEKYKQVIELLDDITLEKLNSAELYTERGAANWQLNNLNNANKDCKKAIEIEPAYYKAYNYLGNVFLSKADYEDALNNYNIAIKLKPDFALTYNNIGLVWDYRKNFQKALTNYNKAIELKPNFAIAYSNRGGLWADKRKYNNALNDYNKAIELNSNLAIAYNGRGTVWSQLKNYEKALDDYNKAIKLNPNESKVYINRGYSFYDIGEYNKAVNDYNKAIELDPSNISIKYWRDKAKALIGEKIQTDEEKPDESFYLFVKAVEMLSGSDRKKILSKCDNIMTKTVDKIRKHASDYTEDFVAHYTKLKVADIIVSNKNSRLRYYNAVYMNDPEEGKILLDCLNDNEIKKAFENGRQKEESNIYLGSFLPETEHDDELVMWRTYGKDEDRNEAMGCSIILESTFFDTERRFLNPEMRRAIESDTKTSVPITPQCLYSVIYYDKRQKTFTGNKKEEITNDLEELKKVLNELIDYKNDDDKSPVNIAIDKIIYHILSELRYFFKSADYAFESELRVIQFAPPESDNVKIDDSGSCLPKRLYIESTKQIQKHIKKIILGPKVPHPEQWMYLEAIIRKNGHDMKLIPSDCKFQ